MVIEITWKKSWSLLRTVLFLPFVAAGAFCMVVVYICGFLWDCAMGGSMEDVREEKDRLKEGVRVPFGPQR